MELELRFVNCNLYALGWASAPSGPAQEVTSSAATQAGSADPAVELSAATSAMWAAGGPDLEEQLASAASMEFSVEGAVKNTSAESTGGAQLQKPQAQPRLARPPNSVGRNPFERPGYASWVTDSSAGEVVIVPLKEDD